MIVKISEGRQQRSFHIWIK